MSRWSGALLFAVLVLLSAPPAYADGPPAVLTTWQPADALSGTWKPLGTFQVAPLTVKDDRCAGHGSSWEKGGEPTRIWVRWYDCSTHGPRFEGLLADRREAQGDAWRAVRSAVGPNAEAIEPLGATGHSRTWMKGSYVVTVAIDCQLSSRAECLSVSALAAVDISSRMPGKPVTLAVSRASQTVAILWGTGLMWGGVLAFVLVVRRLARSTFAVNTRSGRWVSVDPTARTQRTRAVWRRFGVIMVAPLVVHTAFLLPKVASSDLDVGTSAGWALLVVLSLPGVAVLVLARDRGVRPDWRGHRVASLVSWWRRLASRLWSAALLVVFVVTAISLGEGLGVAFVPTSPLGSAMISALGIPLLSLTAFLGRVVRRRSVADAWLLLNSQSGVPLLFLRGFGGQAAKIRARHLVRRGLVSRLFGMLMPQRGQRFEDLFAELVALRGPVRAVDPPDLVVPTLGVSSTTAPFPVRAQRLAGAAAEARGLALVVAPSQVTPRMLVDLRVATAHDGGTQILLCVAPGRPGEISEQLRSFLASVRDIEPFSALPPDLFTDGTLTAVHVPGQGWFAWGASIRDEYGYIHAIDAALTHALANWAEPITATDPEAPRNPVGVLVGPTDLELGAQVTAGLTAMGMTVVPVDADNGNLPAGATLVALLSAAALTDPGWTGALDRHDDGGHRLVPVLCEPLDVPSAPPALTSLNWVNWQAAGPARALTEIFTAVNSSLDRYRYHRDLIARARTWAAGGRGEGLLITSSAAATAAVSHVADSQHDGLARPDALLHEFVDLSAAAASRRRTRNRRLICGGVAAVVAATAITVPTFLAAKQGTVNSSATDLMALSPLLLTDRPDRGAILGGALILQGNAQQADLGRRSLRSAMDTPWPSQFIGTNHDAPIYDAVPISGNRLLSVDGRGTLTQWNTTTAAVDWRRDLKVAAAHVAAARDGTTVAAAADKQLILVTTNPWHRDTIDVGLPVRTLVVAAGQGVAVAGTADGHVIAIGLSQDHPQRVTGAYRSVLDMRTSADERTVWALVRTTADRLAVVDAMSGAVAAEWSVRFADLETVGALSADGSAVAFVGAGRQLWYGRTDSVLHQTGMAMADLGNAVHVLPHGRLVIATPLYGMVVYDDHVGTVTARLRTVQVGVNRVASSADGSTLVALNGIQPVLWDPRNLTTVADGTGAVSVGERPVATSANTTIRALSGGVVEVLGPIGAPSLGYRTRAVSGAVTAVTIGVNLGAVLVGSDRGEVTEIDVFNKAVVRRWQAPNGAPVTAVGWTPQRDRMLVRTADDIWWSAAACDDCGNDQVLLAALRSRLAGCYGEPNLRYISTSTRRALGLRLCVTSPKAQAG